MMAETARRDADGHGDPAAGRPDPGIREALVLEAAACRLAVEEMARDQESGPALEMAERVLSVLEVIAERAFAEEVCEARIASMCARAVEQDRAARGRGHLRAL